MFHLACYYGHCMQNSFPLCVNSFSEALAQVLFTNSFLSTLGGNFLLKIRALYQRAHAHHIYIIQQTPFRKHAMPNPWVRFTYYFNSHRCFLLYFTHKSFQCLWTSVPLLSTTSWTSDIPGMQLLQNAFQYENDSYDLEVLSTLVRKSLKYINRTLSYLLFL